MQVKSSDRHPWFRNSYYRLKCYLDASSFLDIHWDKKILRGEYFDGKDLWIYFEPSTEKEMNMKVDFRTSDVEWLKDRLNFAKSNFEEFLNVKQNDDLKVAYREFDDAFHKTMASYFVCDRVGDVLLEKLERVLPESVCSTGLRYLCIPEETAPVKSLNEIISYLYKSGNMLSIVPDSIEVKKLAEEHAWLDSSYYRDPFEALKNIASRITDPESEFKKSETEKRRILIENAETRNKIRTIFPDNHIVWTWISTVREFIRLDNDDHKYLAIGYRRYGSFFKALYQKLKVRIEWLHPESILSSLDEENKDVEKIAYRRMKEGYVLILDGEEFHEFPVLSEAQKVYNLPKPSNSALSKV